MIPVLMLLGCIEQPSEGTSIGNPTEMILRVASSADVSLEQGSFPVVELTLIDEEANERTMPFEEPLNVLGGGFEVPAGDWVALVFVPDGPTVLTGSTQRGDPVSLILEVSELRIEPQGEFMRLADEPFVLELATPGWLDAEVVGYDVEAPISVDSESPFHDPLVRALRAETRLYEDRDHDGRVGAEERRTGGAGRGRE